MNWWTDWGADFYESTTPKGWPLPDQMSVPSVLGMLNIDLQALNQLLAQGTLSAIYNPDGSICAVYGVTVQALLATWPNPTPPR